MSKARITDHVFPISPGRPGAPIGTREWADYLRISLVSMVDHIGEEDDQLLTTIEFTKQHRAWTLMNKPDGTFFSTIEEFCAFRRPYGLGKRWADLRPFLVAAMAKRGTLPDEIERTLQLETVPEAQMPRPGPGRGKKKPHDASATKTKGNDCPSFVSREAAHLCSNSAEDETEGNDCPSFPTPQRNSADLDATNEKTEGNGCPSFPSRTAKQLRAINRAPEAIKDAYREGRISQTLAAKLGPKDPSPDTAAQIAEVARKIRSIPERKTVDSIVRQHLGAPAPTPVDRLVSALERFTHEQRVEFFERVEHLRAASAR
jgi:hypothetical protein